MNEVKADIDVIWLKSTSLSGFGFKKRILWKITSYPEN